MYNFITLIYFGITFVFVKSAWMSPVDYFYGSLLLAAHLRKKFAWRCKEELLRYISSNYYAFKSLLFERCLLVSFKMCQAASTDRQSDMQYMLWPEMQKSLNVHVKVKAWNCTRKKQNQNNTKTSEQTKTGKNNINQKTNTKAHNKDWNLSWQ